MEYTSTRDASIKMQAAQAIITGLSRDGGLFVPTEIPKMDFKELVNEDYCGVALAVLRSFLPEYSEEFLRKAIYDSYAEPFSGKAGELVCVDDDSLYSLELWHGPTAAFKDYALQLMPKLLVKAREMENETDETIILVATSGDTGGAALAGYANLPGIKISVFYPTGGTSEIQRLQMATQEGDNVCVYAVSGNFDDAQNGVKKAFGDVSLREALAKTGKKLSSANSINWGRLVPQIVYYVTSYLQLCNNGAIHYGDLVDFCVPTGNFGDIMAGYYAKNMGLPIRRLICAANQNNVLADFIKTGEYNAGREFYKTSSPSMDILVSSNLERLLFHECKSDETVRMWMRELVEKGRYCVDEQTMGRIRETFFAGWAGEEEVSAEIQKQFTENEYLCDPHTAVAFRVAQKLKQAGDNTPCVVLSTASPFKFCNKVLVSLEQEAPADAFEALQLLETVSGQKAPQTLAGLQVKTVRFNKEIKPEQISQVPLEW